MTTLSGGKTVTNKEALSMDATKEMKVSNVVALLGITSRNVKSRTDVIHGLALLSYAFRESNPIAIMFASVLAACRDVDYTNNEGRPLTIDDFAKESEKFGVTKNEIAEIYNRIRPAFSITPRLRSIDMAIEIFTMPGYAQEIPDQILTRAKQIYKDTINKDDMSKSWDSNFSLGCIYRACKEANFPYTANDLEKIAARFGISAEASLIVQANQKISRVLNLPPIVIDPGIFIDRFVRALQLGDTGREDVIIMEANEILEYLRKADGINVGTPVSVASASIWLGSIAANDPFSPSQIKKATGSDDNAIKKVAYDIEKKIGTTLLQELEDSKKKMK